ncbi:hypothetical protein O6H91_12G051100 [Diphasiastrum complanatum]|uniref:Uncharacterized protein n=2 Tax=Diphasiastrum complanatum TaxID=34168 RepID=A0ACC2C1K7_DIPCM|nr:hypothetical protein O6H91_12G051100 [Diphasiastrum complanatum]KAJ7535933.1 hypothetical protein O6H91_12G051100 [Diphasiastrum complanatum]
MQPMVGSSYLPTQQSLSADEDKRWTIDASRENGLPSSKQSWRWRGLVWRVKLGVLPPVTAPVEELRRATADGRRRYAEYRRRLLVDPHLMEDGQTPPHDLSMDNPLSMDPDSVWGRFFQNVELESTIDKDLARLYPEHGDYFQGQSCQSMLRRVLLVWSLIHSQCSYRQGMHELLAPFLYVLHVDLEKLSHMKGKYEDHFDDGFTRISLQALSRDSWERDRTTRRPHGDASSSLDAKSKLSKTCGEYILQQDIPNSFDDMDEFGADVATVLMGSDMYGVEGELGSLLSARFIEHDAYCMFDALMNGQGGAVAMVDYYISSSGSGSPLGVPPIIEASAALYRTLAAADASLYVHFVELGVEPQFFALRWLRLLFGREFLLEDLLLVWDAIFAASNQVFPMEAGNEYFYVLKYSARTALIYALAVSMLLYLRPALLAAPDATACLQRLLNFPQASDVRSLIENAKLIQSLAETAARTPPPPIPRNAYLSGLSKAGKSARTGSISPPTSRGHTGILKCSVLQHEKSTPCSPEILRLALPESYWEGRWKSSMLQQVLVDESLSKAASQVGSYQPQVTTRSSDTVSGKQQDGALSADRNSFENQRDDQQEGSTAHTIRFNKGVQAANGMPDEDCDELSGPQKPSADSDQSNIEEEVHSIEPFAKDGHLGSRMRTALTKDDLENIRLPPYSHYENANLFAFQNAAGAAESKQVIFDNPYTSSNFDEHYDKGWRPPSARGVPGPINSGQPSEEVTCSPTCQGIGRMESSSFIDHSKSKEAPRVLAWVCGLDKLNLGEKSPILKNTEGACLNGESLSHNEIASQTVPRSALPERTKYMWNPYILEREFCSSVNSGIASRLLETPGRDCITGEAQNDNNEFQCDPPTCYHEHAGTAKQGAFSVRLQELGQSMLNHIQILESTLTDRHMVDNDSASGPTADVSRENLVKASSSRKGSVACLVAIAELHKISNFLQQL